jgi:nitrogen fixation protein NifU and related proteins
MRSDVYHEAILDHYRHPRGRGTLADPDSQATKTNPLCGESMRVDVALEDDRIRDVRFEDDACAIARASASMMTELVRGRSRTEIAEFITRLRRFVTANPSAADDPALGPLAAFGVIRRTPARVSCVMLAWETLDQALAHTLSSK